MVMSEKSSDSYARLRTTEFVLEHILVMKMQRVPGASVQNTTSTPLRNLSKIFSARDLQRGIARKYCAHLVRRLPGPMSQAAIQAIASGDIEIEPDEGPGPAR